MGFGYLKGLKWSDITREERFFTCVLYNDLVKSYDNTVTFLKDNVISKNSTSKVSKLLDKGRLEVGFEVCLYRDLKKFGVILNEQENFSDKRTFDLCVFAPDGLIIIEAKAQTGYVEKQLKEIRKDKSLVSKALNLSSENIFLVSLHSSKNSPKETTLITFDGYITWDKVANSFPENQLIYLRANDIYNQ